MIQIGHVVNEIKNNQTQRKKKVKVNKAEGVIKTRKEKEKSKIMRKWEKGYLPINWKKGKD